jgi:hypothetical protein
MQDAMMVWESICLSPWFEYTSFVRNLALSLSFDIHITGIDTFSQQRRYIQREGRLLERQGPLPSKILLEIPSKCTLTLCVAKDYDGHEHNVKDGLAYFKKRFLNIHKNSTQSLRKMNSKNRPRLSARAAAVDERKVYP